MYRKRFGTLGFWNLSLAHPHVPSWPQSWLTQTTCIRKYSVVNDNTPLHQCIVISVQLTITEHAVLYVDDQLNQHGHPLIWKGSNFTRLRMHATFGIEKSTHTRSKWGFKVLLWLNVLVYLLYFLNLPHFLWKAIIIYVLFILLTMVWHWPIEGTNVIRLFLSRLLIWSHGYKLSRCLFQKISTVIISSLLEQWLTTYLD